MKLGLLMLEIIVMDLEYVMDVVSLMEEFGFDCIYSVDYCKEILLYGGLFLEGDIVWILGIVVWIVKGLEEV